MSDPAEDRTRRLERDIARLEQEGANLRHWTAELAGSVADTEEKLAGTMERIAERRSPADAARVRAMARDARRYAAKEHDRKAKYDIRSGDDDQVNETRA